MGWDGSPNVGPEERNPIREIALAAAKMGRVNILEWADLQGFHFDSSAVLNGRLVDKPVLCLAAQNGHVNVLEWAVLNNLDVASNSLSIALSCRKRWPSCCAQQRLGCSRSLS